MERLTLRHWIKKFEPLKNGVGKPLVEVLARPKEHWYEMKANEVAQFFTMMNPDSRFFFGKFEEPTFINQRLIDLVVYPMRKMGARARF